ncbi:hypothetical protein LVO79_02450 [Roseivivax marinus]|uniref:hypothetical protein n=1 Tax=Roseivivax marinus TaxID=1379903 RepID=UPI001F032FCC|nr:hypothetical protein [Roseivivax marinus]UMA65342.1 hypothetical protein LVO79_02450 [Roseivivax marinus]
MIATLLVTIFYEFTGLPALAYIAGGLALSGLAAFAPQVGNSRKAFLLIGLLLSVLAVAYLPEWDMEILDALARASFIAALFCALTAIRTAAASSPSIIECGRFLANQAPGRRYIALTIGGHLFGLILLYGSISLLGSLATESAREAPSDYVRKHRVRRMLVAIQRGFASTLMWSPLSFSLAITLSVVPGSSWVATLPFALMGVSLLIFSGWALDTIFKPRPSGQQPAAQDVSGGAWMHHLRPLITLLALVLVSAGVIHFAVGVRVFGAVMALVPLIAVGWVALQASPEHRAETVRDKISDFVLREIPGLNGELVLLAMAGFIGTLGSSLATPLVEGAGVDLSAIPPGLLLVGVFWLIPITGQIGMNPILAVSLIGPLLPTPEMLNIAPVTMVFAITAGWALSGVTSPFTASVLLVASYGGVTPAHVAWRWNAAYVLVVGATVSLLIYALALI